MARTRNASPAIAIPTSKVCRATGIEGRINQDDPADNDFYRDKSQKDGFSPWCKSAEREYNKAYRAGLKVAEAPRVRNIDNEDALNAYNAEHVEAGTRVTRGSWKDKVANQGKRTTRAKATTKARATTRKAKAASSTTTTRTRTRATKKA